MGSMTDRSAIALVAISTSITLLSVSGMPAQGVVPTTIDGTSNTAPAVPAVPDATVPAEAATSPVSVPNSVDAPNSGEATPNSVDAPNSGEATPAPADNAEATDAQPPAESEAGAEQPAAEANETAQTPGEEASVETPAEEAAKPKVSARSPFRSATNTLPVFSNPNDSRLSKAVFAIGGSGRFKEEILWLQWTPPPATSSNPRFQNAKQQDNILIDIAGNNRNNQDSLTQHNYFDISNRVRLVTSCTISNLNYDRNRPQFRNKIGPIQAYDPGHWKKDFLDDLYTIKSGIFTGIKNGGYLKDPTNLPNRNMRQSTPTFDLNCSAQILTRETEDLNAPYTTSVPFDIDGLVIADGESAGYGQNVEEFVEVKTAPGKNWFVLDQIQNPNMPSTNRQPSGTTSSQSDSTYSRITGDTIRVLPNGLEEANGAVRNGPGAVLFAQGVSSAQVTIQGNGEQAIAMGIILPFDLGDAPKSYGEAVAIHHPTWNSSLPQGLTNLNMHTLSTMGKPEFYLGENVNAEKEGKYSELADQDQHDDSLLANFLRFNVEPGKREGIVVKCRGDGGAVVGWIDWNLNGKFDAHEKSNEAPCQNTPGIGKAARIVWTVPDDLLRVVTGEPYTPVSQSVLRLRIVDPAESTLGGGSPMQPTGVTLSGEVEDHGINIYAPTLRLVTEVVDPDGIATSLRPTTDWKVKAVRARSGATPEITYADNGTFTKTVRFGRLVLSTESALPDAILDYSSSAWSCAQSEGATSIPGKTYRATFNSQTNQLNIPEPDHVTCKITHRPKPGTLTWEKLDTNGNHLAGAKWRLTGPSAPAGAVITDCTPTDCTAPAGALKDVDTRPGYFQVEGLKWGQHQLVETHAPAGYILDQTPHTAQVKGTPTDLGQITNEMHRPLVIPLTGGTASIFYVLTGGGLVIAAFAGAAAIGSPGRRRGRA